MPTRPRIRCRRRPVASRRTRPARQIARLSARLSQGVAWRSRARSEAGQAAVELVAVLPLVAAVLLLLWQAALAGHAAWAAAAAARAAARAHAVGADPGRAARDHLPARLERDLQVEAAAAGRVHVAVTIPALPGLPTLGRARATAHFEPQ
jgi:hypothetical protein